MHRENHLDDGLRNMTKKDVNNLTYETLNKCLIGYGYKYNKSEMQFELKKGDYTYFITYIVVDRNPQFKLSFVLDIRNKKIEDIANKFTQSNPSYHKYSATVTVPFNYFKQKRIEFTITKQNDFDEINNFFCAFYQENIKPFLNEYSSIEKLLLFVDNVIQEQNEFIPITIELFKREIILLKLTKNSNFENRTMEINKIIKSYPENDIKNFGDTYEYLKSI